MVFRSPCQVVAASSDDKIRKPSRIGRCNPSEKLIGGEFVAVLAIRRLHSERPGQVWKGFSGGVVSEIEMFRQFDQQHGVSEVLEDSPARLVASRRYFSMLRKPFATLMRRLPLFPLQPVRT